LKEGRIDLVGFLLLALDVDFISIILPSWKCIKLSPFSILDA
jgi:hypothetical protein